MFSPSRTKPYIPVMSSPKDDFAGALGARRAAIRKAKQSLRMARVYENQLGTQVFFVRKSSVLVRIGGCLLRYNQPTGSGQSYSGRTCKVPRKHRYFPSQRQLLRLRR